MNNHDNLLIEILINKKNNLINKNKQRKIKEKYPNILSYLLNRFIDSSSLNETIRRIQYNIMEHPKCPICGKYVNYFGIINNKISFGITCGKSCANKLNAKKAYETKIKRYGNYNNDEKRKKTCLEKYGVDHVWKNKEIHQKSIVTTQQKYNVKSTFELPKSKKTLYDNYGVDNPIKSDIIKEKIKQTLINKYGVEYIGASKEIRNKIFNTLIKKYNVINPFQIESTKNKIKNTWLLKYGVDNPMKNISIREKTYITKRKNNTFNISKTEEELYIYIKKFFKSVKRQYKDKERYPWHCDFYIPELDYFIELNGNWTHGFHPYSLNGVNDKIILEKWKEKSKNHPYYNGAIKTWTIFDVKKREMANRNNLNYKEVWTLEEGKEFIDKLAVEYDKMSYN